MRGSVTRGIQNLYPLANDTILFPYPSPSLLTSWWISWHFIFYLDSRCIYICISTSHFQVIRYCEKFVNAWNLKQFRKTSRRLFEELRARALVYTILDSSMVRKCFHTVVSASRESQRVCSDRTVEAACWCSTIFLFLVFSCPSPAVRRTFSIGQTSRRTRHTGP